MALRFNPFQPNKMVVPGMFTGRVNEITTIERCLFQTKHSNAQHFLIEGERGIGKSSLFFFVSAVASGDVPSLNDAQFNFVVLSLDLGGVASQTEIARAIGRALRQEASNRFRVKEKATELWKFLQKWEVMGVKYKGDELITADDVREQLVLDVAEFCTKCGSDVDGVVILLDEADAPPEGANLGEFVKLFTERLMRKGCNNVLLGLSGLPTLLPKLRISHESSPRVFDVIRLEPLEPIERQEVVERGLALARSHNEFDVKIETKAVQFLSELSEGYPHFIQQFAYSAFDEDVDNLIDLKDVVEGAYKENGALSQLGSKYFSQMYFEKISSSEYRKVLNTMARYGDEWVVRKTLVGESGVKETTLNNALTILKARNVIISDASRQGYYRLPTKSFAAWINAMISVTESTEGHTRAQDGAPKNT